MTGRLEAGVPSGNPRDRLNIRFICTVCVLVGMFEILSALSLFRIILRIESVYREAYPVRLIVDKIALDFMIVRHTVCAVASDG